MQANNPLDLHWTNQKGNIGWIESGAGNKIAAFPSVASGLAADLRQLRIDQSRGAKTVRQLVGAWASSASPAQQASYAQYMARALGVSPDSQVNLSDPATAQAWLRAASLQESGMRVSNADLTAATNGGQNMLPTVNRNIAQGGQAQTQAGQQAFAVLDTTTEIAGGALLSFSGAVTQATVALHNFITGISSRNPSPNTWGKNFPAPMVQ